LGSETVPPTFNLHTAMAVTSTNMPSYNQYNSSSSALDEKAEHIILLYRTKAIINSSKEKFSIDVHPCLDLFL
jgi:hypothetical protein